MVDWQDMHKDFGEKIYWSPDLTYQKLWEEWGFTFEQTKLWIAADFTPQQCYQVIGWKNYGFIPKQAQEWIKLGLEPWEYKYALYAKSKNYNFSTVNCEELKTEYHQAQKWLDFCYPKEGTCLRKNKGQLSISSTTEISQEEVEVVRIDGEQEQQAQIEIPPK